MKIKNEQIEVEKEKYSVVELLEMYNDYSCQCDESGLYDQFLVPKRAEGLYVWFKDHVKPYVDLGMGFSALNFGHQYPSIRKVVKEAIQIIDHVHSFNSESKLLLSKALAEKTPGSPSKKVYFPVGGSMAVETAIKIARAYTGKVKIACFTGAFHGLSYGAMMLTDDNIINKPLYAPYPGEAVRLPYADCYHCDNREKCDFQCLKVAEQHLSQDKDIAALIIEPIQGHAGFIIPPKEFLFGLHKLCQHLGILFIDDEIQVGMGRTGRFLAIEYYDIEPDVVLLSKSLAGGYYPLSAVIARRAIWDSISPVGSGIGSTFVNNPLATKVALEVLRILEEDGLMENATKAGDYFTKRLKEFEQFENIDNVTGLGLIQSFAVVKDKATREPAPEIAKKIQSEALKQCLIICCSGVNKDRIKFISPLWVKKKDIDMILEKLEHAVKTAVAEN
ncbi:aspartate aminotransferase family protein [Chloroflexota bacterium]